MNLPCLESTAAVAVNNQTENPNCFCFGFAVNNRNWFHHGRHCDHLHGHHVCHFCYDCASRGSHGLIRIRSILNVFRCSWCSNLALNCAKDGSSFILVMVVTKASYSRGNPCKGTDRDKSLFEIGDSQGINNFLQLAEINHHGLPLRWLSKANLSCPDSINNGQ